MDHREKSDFTHSKPGDKQSGRAASEPQAPEGTLLRQVQDTKESLSVLKNQVSFANQCLSLLQNQMKHAADTLNILQDQIALAQRTVNNLTEGNESPQQVITHQQSGTTLSQIGSYHAPSGHVPCAAAPMEEQRVIVHDSEGSKIYTLNKSSISLANQTVLASEGAVEQCPALCVAQSIPLHCHCPACLSHTNVQHLSPAFHSHPRSSTHQVSPETPPTQSLNTTPIQMGRDGTAIIQPGIPCPAGHAKVATEYVKEGRNTGGTSAKSDSPSSSHMAHQLLQVIDVLQTADDEDRRGSKTTVTPSHIPGSLIITSDTQPYEIGVGSHYRMSRRSRKQNMSPVKVSSQSSAQQEMKSPVKSVVTREPSDLMRVPAPILASSLEPEFLVVPSSSFSYDSPPTSATDHPSSESSSKKEVKPCHDSRVAITSTAGACEPTVGSGVVSPGNSKSGAAWSLSTKAKFADLQDVCRVANEINEEGRFENSGKHKSYDDESQSRDKVCSVASSGITCDLSSLASKVAKSGKTNENGSSSLLKHKRFPGTSPLNSEISMPFDPPCPTERRNQSNAHNSTEPVVSSSAVPANTEYAQSVAISRSNHISSQASPMTVLSLPNSTESHAVNSQRSTSSAKKPIILSRRTSRGEQNIPQGLVVLVPTIEDAKRLIATTGTNTQGQTPVLVPQHMLSDIQTENAAAEDELDCQQQINRKRHFDMVSPSHSVSSKRPAVDSVVID